MCVYVWQCPFCANVIAQLSKVQLYQGSLRPFLSLMTLFITHTLALSIEKKKRNLFIEKKNCCRRFIHPIFLDESFSVYWPEYIWIESNGAMSRKNCNSVTLANSGYFFFFFLRFQHSKHFFIVYFGIFAGSHYFTEMSKECRVFVCVSSLIYIIHSV